MEERNIEGTEPAQAPVEASAPAQTPAFGRGVAPAQSVQITVDAMPQDKAVLARMSPEQRSAIYLNQIRKMMIFFVVFAVIGIIAGVIIGIVDINEVSKATQPCIGLGC
jgi:hypothetical protein